jgi:hypothetical protein
LWLLLRLLLLLSSRRACGCRGCLPLLLLPLLL